MDIAKARSLVQGYLQPILAPVVRALARLGVSPNQVTLIGFLITVVSAGLLVLNYQLTAGLVFILGSAFDLLDGTLARQEVQATTFGAFLDSVLDRVGEGAMFAAIAYHLALEGLVLAVAAVVVAMLGGMLTSYTRARAEALGIACAVGWVSRPERVLLIGCGLIFDVVAAVIYVLAVLTLWTTGQRMAHVYKALRTQS